MEGFAVWGIIIPFCRVMVIRGSPDRRREWEDQPKPTLGELCSVEVR